MRRSPSVGATIRCPIVSRFVGHKHGCVQVGCDGSGVSYFGSYDEPVDAPGEMEAAPTDTPPDNAPDKCSLCGGTPPLV